MVTDEVGVINVINDHINGSANWQKVGVIARQELWRQIENNRELLAGESFSLIQNQQESRALVDRQFQLLEEQRFLTDDEKQQPRNAGKYRRTGLHWICKECRRTGDKFYIKVHFCLVFLKRQNFPATNQ